MRGVLVALLCQLAQRAVGFAPRAVLSRPFAAPSKELRSSVDDDGDDYGKFVLDDGEDNEFDLPKAAGNSMFDDDLFPPSDDDSEFDLPKAAARAKVVDDDDDSEFDLPKAAARAKVADDDDEDSEFDLPKAGARAKVVDDLDEDSEFDLPKAAARVVPPSEFDDEDSEFDLPKAGARAKEDDLFPQFDLADVEKPIIAAAKKQEEEALESSEFDLDAPRDEYRDDEYERRKEITMSDERKEYLESKKDKDGYILLDDLDRGRGFDAEDDEDAAYLEANRKKKKSPVENSRLDPFDIEVNVGTVGSSRGAYLDDEEGYYYTDEIGDKWRKARIKELMESRDLYGDVLNALFTPDPEERLRWDNAPETAFGAVFSLSVLAEINITPLYMAAWTEVAELHGKKPPSAGDVELALGRDLLHEYTILNVFEWTTNVIEARELGALFDECLRKVDLAILDGEDNENSWMPAAKDERTAIAVREGAEWWLSTLKQQEVPCALVTRLPRRVVKACLDRLDLQDYFGDRIVCQESKRVDADQALLHAALALERQPMRCAVFSDSVNDLIQAREAGMRSVGVIGKYAQHDMHVADLAIARLDELRLSNIRKLFADFEFEPEPELELEVQVKTTKTRWDTPSTGGTKNRWTEIKKRYGDEDEDSPDTETQGPGGGDSGSYRRRYGRR